MRDQSIQKKGNKGKRVNNSRVPIHKTFGENITIGFQGKEGVDAGYFIWLPEIRFSPHSAPRVKMAEIAKIFYSTSYPKEKKPIRQSAPEALSSILPRVMAKLVRLRRERTN